MAFWSAIVKQGGKPAVFVPPPEGWTLHLSQAALPATVPEGKRVSVVHKAGEDDESPVIICTLKAGSQDSVPLDLFLDSYAEFSLVGATGAEVHLTGYYSPPDAISGPGDDEDEDEEFDPMGEDDEDDDLPPHMQHLKGAVFMNGDDEDDDEDDEDEDDEEDEDEDGMPGVTRRPHVTIEELPEEPKAAKAKAAKQEAKAAKPEAAAAGTPAQAPGTKAKAAEQPTSGTKRQAEPAKGDQPASKKQAAEQKAAKAQASPAQEVKGSKKNVRTYENGFSIEDVSMGPPNGKLAKKGKRVQMAYVGRLKSNNKVFDASKGKPFAFRLGVGEVIKGWDLGVEGMRVGDKRKLVIPPQLAYGTAGVKGAIPPNATLEFDVELLDVK